MVRGIGRIASVALVAAFVVAGLMPGEVAAQDRRQNAVGRFDFYVLALSWSPSFCEEASERAPNRPPPRPQCGERPYSFVVHGLWPQYERGFPEYCQVPAPRLDRRIVSAMLDLMPSRRLIYNQWDKHGTCSGLSQNAYFQAIRKARAVVKIPDAYIDPQRILSVTPNEVEEAFIKVNPSLSRSAIAVDCGGPRLREVRICMTKDYAFRDCAEVDRRACRRDRLVMPPARGGPARGGPGPDERR